MGDTLITLDRSPVVRAWSLSKDAGWNQTEADWARLIRLEPEGCFGFEHQGAIVATTTVLCYGRALAWIGMVATDPAHRRRGLARRLVERALDFAADRGVAWVKLDATEMGLPLYRSLGFEEECVIERWIRPVSPLKLRTGPLDPFHLDPGLDARAFGTDRRQLIEALARDGSGASVPGGYALGRPGMRSAHFGPCVADGPDHAHALLGWYLERHEGHDVSWDVLSTNREAGVLARKAGFEPVRRLVRMVRPSFPSVEPFRSEDRWVYATAGFEYG